MAGEEMCRNHPELRFLPESPLKMTLQQTDHVITRLRAIAAEKTRVCDEMRAVLDIVLPRVTDRVQTIGELAPEKGVRWEKLMDRSEELEAAFDALHNYMDPLYAAAGGAG